MDSLFTAALLAADLTATVDRAEALGFQQRDVRFFYLLFRNWLEVDVRHPDADLDLTRVRRELIKLGRRGRVRELRKARRRRGVRTPRQRYVLTLAGVLALVDELVTASPLRPFEETLFVILFAASYRELLIRRVEQASAPVARRRIARALDPKQLIAHARRDLVRQCSDLEERISSGDELRDAADRAFAEGKSDAETVAILERISTYQLHYVRPLGDLLLSLPPRVRRYEIGDGITARRDLMFAPLLRLVRAQLDVIGRLESAATAIAAGQRLSSAA
ncbi:MAG: hypothetical protein ACKV2T_02870 [Kofleriaceae bacterium]